MKQTKKQLVWNCFFKSKKNIFFSQLEFGYEGDKVPKRSPSSFEDNKRKNILLLDYTVIPPPLPPKTLSELVNLSLCAQKSGFTDWLLLCNFVINEFP